MKKISIILVVITMIIVAFNVLAEDEPVIKVISFEGDVKVLAKGETKPKQCVVNCEVEEGDMVITGRNAYAALAFEGREKTIVKIKEKSQMVVNLTQEKKIELIDGEVLISIGKLKKGEEFKVKTPCAICGARGTGWNVKTNKEVTEITVFEDEVFVYGIGEDGKELEKEHWVKEGELTRVIKNKEPLPPEKADKLVILTMKKEAALLLSMLVTLDRFTADEKYSKIEQKHQAILNNRLERAEDTLRQRPVEMPMPAAGRGRDDKDK